VKNLKLLILAIGLTFTSCSNDNGSTQEQEAQSLEKMHVEILSLSTSKQCENSADWALLQLVLKPVADLPDLLPIH
jgi:hypothetical protein